MKKALITGITGQDGSFLAELLLEKGYEVYGLVRKKSNINYGNIEHIKDRIHFIAGDMTDIESLNRIVEESYPDEVYNFAAQSFVGVSWEQPVDTFNVNAIGCLNLLESLRKIKSDAKFFQASTAEIFGKTNVVPQNEDTVFNPKSPYAVSKVCAHYTTKNYRESYGMFACSGILFNHESERRGKEFLTRKITNGVARIVAGKQDYIELGNLNAKRDWGYSKDYVYAMWLMLQQDKPEDFVISTNENHTVREFIEIAFKYVGIDVKWQGSGLDEIAINKENGKTLIKVNSNFIRPADVNVLKGDASKAKKILGWEPEVNFENLVKIMLDNDLKLEGVN